MHRIATLTALTIPALVFSQMACVSLGRNTPRLEQYVLGAESAGEAAEGPQNGDGLTLGLRRLDLARYLAVPAIVVRRGAHEIVISEYHRWGENLDLGINRVVAAYLSAATPIHAVDIAPWTARTAHDYLIQLHISRFEGVLPDDSLAGEGEVHLLASWELIQQDGALAARGITDYRARGWKAGDYSGLVTLLDTGLNGLAQEVVSCLRRVVATRAGRPGEDETIPALTLTCAADRNSAGSDRPPGDRGWKR